MAKTAVGVFLHFVFAVYFIIVMHYDLKIYTPGVLEYGWRWKYLTFIDLVSE